MTEVPKNLFVGILAVTKIQKNIYTNDKYYSARPE
jgi:hypothetical protein